MCRQGWVGSWVGWHSPVGQRGSMDMRVEPRGESGVWRRLHWAGDHQLKQAATQGERLGPSGGSQCAHLGLWPVLPNATSLTAHACHPNTPEVALSLCPWRLPPPESGLLGGELGAPETGKGMMGLAGPRPGPREEDLRGWSYNPTRMDTLGAVDHGKFSMWFPDT